MRRAEDAGNVVVLQIPSEALTNRFFEANEDVYTGTRTRISLSVSAPGPTEMPAGYGSIDKIHCGETDTFPAQYTAQALCARTYMS